MGDAPERIKASVVHSLPEGPAYLCWPVDSPRKGRQYVRADLYAALEAEIARLLDRLEVRHAYDGNGNRIEVEQGSIPDGIATRDETIRQQGKLIDKLREDRIAAMRRAYEAGYNTRKAGAGLREGWAVFRPGLLR